MARIIRARESDEDDCNCGKRIKKTEQRKIVYRKNKKKR